MRLTIEYLYNTKYICNQLTAEFSFKLHRMGCLLMSFKRKVYIYYYGTRKFFISFVIFKNILTYLVIA